MCVCQYIYIFERVKSSYSYVSVVTHVQHLYSSPVLSLLRLLSQSSHRLLEISRRNSYFRHLFISMTRLISRSVYVKYPPSSYLAEYKPSNAAGLQVFIGCIIHPNCTLCYHCAKETAYSSWNWLQSWRISLSLLALRIRREQRRSSVCRCHKSSQTHTYAVSQLQ